MKEIEILLKTVADGLKAMGEGIQSIARKVDDIAKTQTSEKAGKPQKPVREKTKLTSNKRAKKAKPKGPRAIPATEKVLNVIKKSKSGVDNATIAAKTGLNRKQVVNALSQLKKTGKVKSIQRGVHTIV